MRKLFGFLLLALVVFATSSAGATRFDIVVILTDDQRWDTLQYMPIVTQQLINKGVTFRNAFVTTPLCCPSRSTILTGLYAHRHGVLDNDAPDGGATAFKDAQTLAVWLQGSGYRTALFGKYLNDYSQLGAYVPPGWSEWAARSGGKGIYYDYQLTETGETIVQYGTSDVDYSTNVYAAKAVSFIESTPSGTNLFLVIAPAAPHKPWIPATQDKGTYAGVTPWRPPSYNEADVSDKPAWVRALPLFKDGAGDNARQKQIESLQAVDRAVGRIIDALSRAGRLDSTVIIFLSDNGLSWGEHRWLNDKACPYEECIRIPFVVRDPAAPGIPRVDDHPVLNLDIAPAVLKWAGGVTAPWTFPYQSRNLADLVRDPASTAWRSSFLVEMTGVSDPPRPAGTFSAVRMGGAKGSVYVEYDTGEREFYDLAKDPYQMRNAYGDPTYADKIESMRKLLESLKNK